MVNKSGTQVTNRDRGTGTGAQETRTITDEPTKSERSTRAEIQTELTRGGGAGGETPGTGQR